MTGTNFETSTKSTYCFWPGLMCMNALKLYKEISSMLEEAFHQIESMLPKPVLVKHGDDHVFRYQNQTAETAAIQKCARIVSGLNSSLVLLKAGHYQELGANFRMLDEFIEDTIFLCEAIRTGEYTELHDEYLKYFFQEEFDCPENPFLSSQNRPTISRRKIQAALARSEGNEVNPSDSQELLRTISQSYSGFVHGASAHVMEMYGGDPPRYYLEGMLGTPREEEYYNNAWDYFYRAIHAVMFLALGLNMVGLLQNLFQFRSYVEEQSGRTEWEDPAKLMKKNKAKKRE